MYSVRYSLVRQQGFADTTQSTGRHAKERQILDYTNQQYRLFKQLCTAYAFIFTGKTIGDTFQRVMAEMNAGGAAVELPALHGTSAGLKALCTFEGASGLEDLRKCCGGHGVLLTSGIGPMALDYVTYNTAEGDMIILELQAARYLMKTLDEAKIGVKATGLTSYLNDYNDDLSAALTTSATTTEDFQDVELLKLLMRNRALVAVLEASEKLNDCLARKMSLDDSWNDCAVDLVRCSRLHCYYMLFSTFSQQVASDPAVSSILRTMCITYGLMNIAEDLGSFEFTRKQKQMIRNALSKNMPILRNDAAALVDAFEFSDNILNSAIGKYDGRVYEALFQSALESPLNKVDPFLGYQEYLRPILDLEFIQEHATMQRTDNKSKL